MVAREAYNRAMRQVHEDHHSVAQAHIDHPLLGYNARRKTALACLALLKLGKEHFEGKRALDIGSGTGAYLDLAREMGADARGVDVLPTRADVMQVTAESERLPFGDREFDVVTLGRVFSMARDPLALAKEVKRVLKPGGLIVVEDVVDTPLSTTKIGQLVESKAIKPDDARKIMRSIRVPVERDNDGKAYLSKVDPGYIAKLFAEPGVNFEHSGVPIPAPPIEGAKPTFFMLLRHVA